MNSNCFIFHAPLGIFYLWYYDREGKRQKISTARRLKAGAEQKTPTGDVGHPIAEGRRFALNEEKTASQPHPAYCN
jgi:hypothetical protein